MKVIFLLALIKERLSASSIILDLFHNTTTNFIILTFLSLVNVPILVIMFIIRFRLIMFRCAGDLKRNHPPTTPITIPKNTSV